MGKQRLKDFDKFSSQLTLSRTKVIYGYMFVGEDELRERRDFRHWINDPGSRFWMRLSNNSMIVRRIESLTLASITRLDINRSSVYDSPYVSAIRIT